MEARDVVEVIAAVAIPVVFTAVLIERTVTKKGIGVRAIQFVALGALLPIILILALERVLEPTAIAALLGGVAGYVLANIGKFDEKRGPQ